MLELIFNYNTHDNSVFVTSKVYKNMLICVLKYLPNIVFDNIKVFSLKYQVVLNEKGLSTLIRKKVKSDEMLAIILITVHSTCNILITLTTIRTGFRLNFKKIGAFF